MRFPSDDELMAGPNAFADEAYVDLADLATERLAQYGENYRAGFVSLVGRPNAGKSTLTNALVGQKVAITSMRPQTTRHTIRGIVHRPDAQLVLVDTPGIHRPRNLLGKRLNSLVKETMAEVDVVVMCIPADEKIGPGDRYIAAEISHLRATKVAAVTKSEKVSREALLAQLLAVQELGIFDEIIPVSALAGRQIDDLADLLARLVPLSPPLYPADSVTDETDDKRIAELVREAALEGVRDELPHSLAVTVDEIIEREGTGGKPGVLAVHISIHVERDSQKAIVIGKGGARLREVGTAARREIEALLGRRIYLDLHVRTAKDWQRDPKQLGKLGF
ncbi:GTPase Era [Buchananella hordeovulneris]|uniref:GTPase Era n=1 Tax=Buchananella hordeovulneris TaxID=52770 RepID=A0A1Q5PX79_9ACTO|nr:GTPase Era [Buchananella hordeovulneris]OKL52025.1 GTPase Era [Buchananella hordeovulneris]RRD45165.1 GTPase Era [Buchananella hordeovulneris]RRD52621.1 GTPase Era [Buchananella hordeovulneris]